MDFFSEFSKRFTNAARSVVSDKGKDAPETARLAEELREASDELEQLFALYGRVCFAGENGDATADLTARIRAGMARVEALSARREDWQGARRCAACGASQPRSARFCANCGKRLADDATPQSSKDDARRYCPRCGAVLADAAGPCPVCGTDAEAPTPAPEPPAARLVRVDAEVLAGIDPEEPAPGDAE